MSPFEQYKDEINYDVILEGNIKYRVKGFDESPKPTEDQLIDGEEKIFKYINNLLTNEDYLYECFKETGIARGRIYGEFSDKDVNEDKLYLKFGISTQEAEKEIVIEDVVDYFKGFMEDLDSDVELQSVTGWSSEDEEVEPTDIVLETYGEPTVNIIKNDLTENVDLNNIDRQLVLEGKLNFIKENNYKVLQLNDSGTIELYENNECVSMTPFSKLGVQKLYKSIITEGYELTDQDIKIDPQNLEQTKENVEQAIKQVDEIQELKNTLDDKIDNLTTESKMEEEKINHFVSTKFTQRKLTPNEIYDIKPEQDFTIEQVGYLTKVFGSLEGFKASISEFANLISVMPDKPFISIDEYVSKVVKELEN